MDSDPHRNEPALFGPSNPYAARQLNDPAVVDGDPLTQLTVVATILLSMAMFTLALNVLGLGWNLMVGLGLGAPPNLGGLARIGFLIGQVVWMVVPMIVQLVVILGAIAMIRRRGIRLAWSGVICSLVPFCGPCFGLSIPVAIWGVVLLVNPGVKAAFS